MGGGAPTEVPPQWPFPGQRSNLCGHAFGLALFSSGRDAGPHPEATLLTHSISPDLHTGPGIFVAR